MKTRSLFASFAILCATAILTGCATTNRRVSSSALDERNPPRVETPAAPPLPEHAVLDANAFRKLDLNADGAITLDEWQQFDKSPVARDNFQSLDENGDGQINVTEFLTWAPKHSKRYHFLGDTDETDDSFVSSDSNAPQNLGWHLFSFHF